MRIVYLTDIQRVSGDATMSIVVIAHNKGGVGKTTSAMNLIGELKPDLIIDLDVHESLSVINKMRADDKMLPVVVCKDKKHLLKVMSEADDKGQDIFIDCGGFDSDLTQTAISLADLLIVPANDTITERIGLLSFDALLTKLSKSLDKQLDARLLLCKVHPSRKNFEKIDELLENTNHLKRLTNVISYRAGYTESLEYGLGVTESVATRSSPAGKELTLLANEIKSLLTK